MRNVDIVIRYLLYENKFFLILAWEQYSKTIPGLSRSEVFDFNRDKKNCPQLSFLNLAQTITPRLCSSVHFSHEGKSFIQNTKILIKFEKQIELLFHLLS